jgi:Undecaprenyl-phosphate glucose phosphotransferase
MVDLHRSLAIVIAALFLVIGSLRGDYSYANLTSKRRAIEQLMRSWSITVICILFLLFMTKTSSDFSRGALVISYFVGLVFLSLVRRTAATTCIALAGYGRIAGARMMLVGTEAAISHFRNSARLSHNGTEIVETVVIVKSGECALSKQLETAVEIGRRCRPDEIMVILEWGERQLIHDCVSALLALPASISLGSEPFHIPVPGYELATTGACMSLQLARKPLGTKEFLQKRLFDMLVAGSSLLILAPVLVCIALAIRIETPGPILYQQKRYGFNRRPFEIYKFRSMYVKHCGESFRQTVENDRRITRVGRFLRKLNLDELPQLINVLRGEMSLVGPRPHPLDLDDHFASRLLLYARRHNVLPGITGWAQINGFRGATDEEWKMRGRLLHDLHYLDNWSVLFDMKILALTLLTPKGFINAV